MSRIDAAVLLVDPKFGENVGGAIRTCAAFEIPVLRWTGTRVPVSKRVLRYGRFNTEADHAVDYGPDPDAFEALAADLTPVAVELSDDAVSLPDFEHPERALYVFGPEDGTLSKRITGACAATVIIPGTRCMNLASCVSVVAYDRAAKLQRALATIH